MNKVIFILLFLFASCKGSPSEATNLVDKENPNGNCKIPTQILNYIKKNEDNFKFIDVNKELKLLHDFINENTCPIFIKGDFNQNGIEDVALILRYTEYKVSEYKNYDFPFLVVFNDYEKEVKPIILYKTGDYADEDIKTVIYDQFENGIFSYIQNGSVCNKDVIDIIIPEKSTFHVIWNDKTQQYEYFNVLDTIDCVDKNYNSDRKNDIFETMQGAFDKDLCTPTNDIGTAICEDYQLIIEPQYILLKTQGHMTDREDKLYSRQTSKGVFQIYNDSNDTVGVITIVSDSLFLKYSKFLKESEEEMEENGYFFDRTK